jgi:dTDP-4-dehydrorhamnose 3,5-epimerase
MQHSPLPIPDLILITPRRIGDSRGYFSEFFKESWFRAEVADVGFVQDNQSLSAAAGTLRGLHFQLPPFAQGKLVSCLAGAIFDVGVDIRQGSPSFGQWAGAELSAENGRQLWIPPGFAHGFVTLTPDTLVHYKVTSPYSAAHDRGILFDDPDIAVDWPLSGLSPVLSDKDRRLPRLRDIGPAFRYDPSGWSI